MNAHLVLSAAALLATTATATAAAYSFSFGTRNGGSYCDGGILVTQNDRVRSAAWRHINNNCHGATIEGVGILTGVKKLDKVYPMSDTYPAEGEIYSEQLTYTLPAKPKNGARWTLWIGFDGISSFEGDFGVLKHVTNETARIFGTGVKSTTTAVEQVLAGHRRSGE